MLAFYCGWTKPLKESACIFSSLVLCKDRVYVLGGEGHRKCLETVNPTLCHLSDKRIPTECGMYNKICFYCCGIYSRAVNL